MIQSVVRMDLNLLKMEFTLHSPNKNSIFITRVCYIDFASCKQEFL